MIDNMLINKFRLKNIFHVFLYNIINRYLKISKSEFNRINYYPICDDIYDDKIQNIIYIITTICNLSKKDHQSLLHSKQLDTHIQGLNMCLIKEMLSSMHYL